MKAFPIVIDRETQIANNTNYGIQEEGMDLRDYFAAHAMQVLLKRKFDKETEITFQIKMLTIDAYEIADEMMKARNDQE